MEKKKLTKKDKIVYALIVLMGVAAFIISTIWLCKTEEAEASQVSYKFGGCFESVNINGFESQLLSVVGSCNKVIQVGGSYYFNNTTCINNNGVIGFCVFVEDGVVTYVSTNKITSSIPSNITIYASFSDDGTGVSGGGKTALNNAKSSVQYNAIVYPTVTEVTLPTFQGNLYSDIWYFQKNEPYHVSYADRKISVLFNIVGDVPEYAALHPEDSFRLKTDFTYYLPAPSYVKNWVLNGKKPEELLLPVNRKDFEANYASSSMGVSFRGGLDCEVSKEVISTTGEIRFRIDPLESLIHDSAAKISGIDWQSYYGLTDSEWAVYKDVIFGYSVFTKLSTVLYAKDTASSYVYGGLYTVSVLEVDNFLDTYIDKEYSEVTEVEQERAEKDRLSELLGTQDGTIEDLKQQIKDMQDTQNALGGDLQGTDLWSGFSTLSKGLSSLGPALSAISSIVGSVLSFVPAPITSTMGFTFLAICIVALIKAIK